MLAWKLWHLGYPDQAVAVCDEAVRYARELKHTHTRGYVETFGAVRIQLFRGDREGVDRYVNSMLTFYEEHKLLFWLGFAKVFEGWSLSEQGRHEEAIEVIGAGLRAHEQTRTAMFKPHTYAILAQAQAQAGCGRFNEALQILDDALAIAERTSEHWITPELYRLQGELMLESAVDPGVTTKAQVCFERALTLARQHQAKSWELRSATSLARLWQQQGNQVAARDMLVEIYDWFSEGFQSRDLEQAKSLLQALA